MQVKTFDARRSLKAIAIVVLATMIALLTAYPGVAFADETPSSPNEIYKDISSGPLGGLPMMGDDYVWLGRDLELSGHTVKNDFLIAGQNLKLSECMANGSIRAAGQDISIKDCYIAENITAAGQYVVIKDCNAKAIAVAGATVSITGSCDDLTVYAEKVIIDGEVKGDAVIGASNVEIGEGAYIKGTLHVSSDNEPVVQNGAMVGEIDFSKVDKESTEKVEGAFAGLAASLGIMFAILGVIGTFIIALLAELMFRRQTAGAAEMIRNRTGAHIGTGIVAALVAPIAIIILLCFGVTWPVAGALTLALLAMTVVAEGFAGASLFKLAFPKLGRFKCAMAGGAIMGVASAIPILGAIVGVASFMYLLGYVLQSIFLGMRDEPRPPISPTAHPTAAPIASAPITEPIAPPAQPE